MMANQRDQEEGCFAVSFERKYYHRPGVFIKRTLRPREFRSGYQRHLHTLQTLVSRRIGGPTGIVVPPYRAMRRTEEDEWKLRTADREDYVFCHNDLSQHNILVDRATLAIRAIVDWEYAGFYPAFFEYLFHKRLGPSVALEGEVDDAKKILGFLESQIDVGRPGTAPSRGADGT